MKFTKMQGIGNDYIYFNCFENTIENPEELSRRLSDRHFGIGGDGICLITPSDRADAFMDLYNADGSRAMMCGNGIRCVGKYVYERGLCKKDVLNIDTLSGIKTLYLTVENDEVTQVRVDMGEPILEPARIPTTLPEILAQDIQANGTVYTVTAVSMGNPHSVIFVDDVDSLDLEKIGPALENHPVFPQRVNTEFVQVISPEEVKMRVWERGSGETWACGTGACATVVACFLNGKTGRKVRVHLRGGDLTILWNEDTRHVEMTGPAAFVFDGEISL